VKNKVIFAFVLVLFLITRIYKIAEIPASVYWDEASIGYNAYSIATDLKDEWGVTLPIHFRAFGEFKLPVYIYSTAILVKAIGLNAYAVRLPAVFYSFGTLIVVYLLTKKITRREGLAILSVFILTVSPWFFIFSRTGYEATAGLFFFLLGTYLFLLLRKNKVYLLAAILSFIFSFYSYNSFRIIIPIWLVLLFVYKFREIINKDNRLILGFSLVLFLLSLVPVYRLYKFDAGGVRFAEVQITSGRQFVTNYFSHFSPDFLILTGDSNPRSQIPGHGELYFLDIPLIILGLIAIVKSKKVLFYLPLAALLLAPIPAALTKESPHALRALLAAPSLAMISAFGVGFLGEKFKKYGVAIILIVIAGYYFSFGPYAIDFVTKYSTETASDWQYQYKQIFENQKSGVVTDKYAQPYVFALYYLKYPPEKFRREVKLNPVNDWGFSKVASFNGFQFVKE
jgi:4-amino-4-deoxy-L-arabinose transferase-like glycosyltransferase